MNQSTVGTIKIDEVLEITSGFAFKSEYFNENHEGLPLIRCRDVNSGIANVFYSGDFDPQYVVRNGDLLVSMDGDFRVVRWGHGDALLNQRVCRLEPNQGKLDPGYLFHFLPKELDLINSKTSFATVKHLSAKSIRDIEIPLPPLPEQKRIADILDKADAIRRKRREACDILSSNRIAAFQWLFGDPVANAKKWDRVPLKEILESIDSGVSPKCLDRPVSAGEWGVLKLGAVTWCEYDWTQNKALPPNIEPDSSIEVKCGDLLFTRKNTYDLVAATAFVYETPSKLMMPDLIFRLRIKPDAAVIPEYLWGLMTYPTKRRQIQALAGGAAGSMPNISKAKLLEELVEIPPKNLQLTYKGYLNKARSFFETSERSRNQSSDLFNSLVQRAFRGEL